MPESSSWMPYARQGVKGLDDDDDDIHIIIRIVPSPLCVVTNK